MSDLQDQMRLHSAGATVRHSSPFSRLEVPAIHDAPSRDFAEKWVKPFYMLNLWDDSEPFVGAIGHVARSLDDAVIAELLSYFDWRPRIVGAYFVATKRISAFEEQIGHLLLRSDVCYAGVGYCAALGRLNSPAAIAFLETYLDYYLTRPDLWFDQGDAMAALGYLDQQNGTARRARFNSQWRQFTLDKPRWDLSRNDASFRRLIRTLEAAAQSVA